MMTGDSLEMMTLRDACPRCVVRQIIQAIGGVYHCVWDECQCGNLLLCGMTETRTLLNDDASGFMRLRNITGKSRILRKRNAAETRYTIIPGVILIPVISGGCC